MEDSPQMLVRSYSSDLQERDGSRQTQLERIVGSKEQLRQQEERDWRLYFERWDPSEAELKEASLRNEGVHLMKAWKEFSRHFPKETSGDLQRKAPNVTDVINTVKGICSTWDDGRKQGKWGQARQYLHGFCNGLNNHATLLELLPASSEYVSLFTGSIASLVKASVNHEKVATEIAKSLNEITDIVADCVETCQMHKTEKIEMCIAMMYAYIFLFLNDAMTWFRRKSWRRLLDSFNENFYDEFEEKIVYIRKLAAQVKWQANMGQAAEQRVTRLAVEQMQPGFADMRVWASGKAREAAETAEMVKSLERKIDVQDKERKLLLLESSERLQTLATLIGDRMFDMLESRATDWLEMRNARARITATETCPEEPGSSSDGLSPSPSGERHERIEARGRDNLLESSRDLELFFVRGQIRPSFDLPLNIRVPGRISNRLRDFAADAEEKVLAIAGPRGLDHRGLSTMTKVAASFVQYAEEARLPVISWFCELPTSASTQRGTSIEMAALLSLMYALIRQVIEKLPLEPAALDGIGIDSLEIKTLDGTSNSIATAIQLLQDLLKQIDSPLFIVIDGLQWLDDVSTDQYLGECIEALTVASANTRRANDSAAPAVRILFTTAGRSRALLNVLDTNAYLLADDGSHSRKRAGGSSLAW